MSTTTETLTWHKMPDSPPPDAETTVLAELLPPDDDDQDTTEVWPAFWAGERWIEAGSGWPIEAHRVVAWADVPRGTRGAA